MNPLLWILSLPTCILRGINFREVTFVGHFFVFPKALVLTKTVSILCHSTKQQNLKLYKLLS